MPDDEKIFEMLRNVGEKIVELEKKLECVWLKTEELNADDLNIKARIEKLEREVGESISNLVKRIEKLEKETDLMNSDWTQMDNMLDKVKFNIDANRDQINDNLEALQNHNKELSELKALIKAHDINLDSLGGSMQNRKDEIAELKEKSPEQDAGSASARESIDRQTEKSDDEWVLVKRDGTTEIYGAKYFILVRTADLEFVFSKDPEFMNMEELKRRRKIKEKYLTEEAEK